MRLWQHEYPYTDFHELNLDWVIATVKKLSEQLDSMEARIVELTRQYVDEVVDEKIRAYQESVDAEISALSQLVDNCITDFNNLQSSVNISLRQMEIRIDDLYNILYNELDEINALTDLKIEQNNEYLISHMETELANIKVNNTLTGTMYTLQNMFNYLCELHMTDAITYTELATKQNTYTQLAGYHMTYTELAIKGDLIIQ